MRVCCGRRWARRMRRRVGLVPQPYQLSWTAARACMRACTVCTLAAAHTHTRPCLPPTLAHSLNRRRRHRGWPGSRRRRRPWQPAPRQPAPPAPPGPAAVGEGGRAGPGAQGTRTDPGSALGRVSIISKRQAAAASSSSSSSRHQRFQSQHTSPPAMTPPPTHPHPHAHPAQIARYKQEEAKRKEDAQLPLQAEVRWLCALVRLPPHPCACLPCMAALAVRTCPPVQARWLLLLLLLLRHITRNTYRGPHPPTNRRRWLRWPAQWCATCCSPTLTSRGCRCRAPS